MTIQYWNAAFQQFYSSLFEQKETNAAEYLRGREVDWIALEEIDLHLFTDQWKKSCMWVVVYFNACK